MHLEIHTRDEFSRGDWRAWVAYLRTIWQPKPDQPLDIDEFIDMLLAAPVPEHEKFLILKDNSEIVGSAKIFARHVFIGEKSYKNMALANVSSSPLIRGSGYGRLVVQKAFEYVDNGAFECSIFQTKVPGFYEKLGARILVNTLHISENDSAKPFWDPHIMMYPSNIETKDLIINLRGKGY